MDDELCTRLVNMANQAGYKNCRGVYGKDTYNLHVILSFVRWYWSSLFVRRNIDDVTKDIYDSLLLR